MYSAQALIVVDAMVVENLDKKNQKIMSVGEWLPAGSFCNWIELNPRRRGVPVRGFPGGNAPWSWDDTIARRAFLH